MSATIPKINGNNNTSNGINVAGNTKVTIKTTTNLNTGQGNDAFGQVNARVGGGDNLPQQATDNPQNNFQTHQPPKNQTNGNNQNTNNQGNNQNNNNAANNQNNNGNTNNNQNVTTAQNGNAQVNNRPNAHVGNGNNGVATNAEAPVATGKTNNGNHYGQQKTNNGGGNGNNGNRSNNGNQARANVSVKTNTRASVNGQGNQINNSGNSNVRVTTKATNNGQQNVNNGNGNGNNRTNTGNGNVGNIPNGNNQGQNNTGYNGRANNRNQGNGDQPLLITARGNSRTTVQSNTNQTTPNNNSTSTNVTARVNVVGNGDQMTIQGNPKIGNNPVNNQPVNTNTRSTNFLPNNNNPNVDLNNPPPIPRSQNGRNLTVSANLQGQSNLNGRAQINVDLVLIIRTNIGQNQQIVQFDGNARAFLQLPVLRNVLDQVLRQNDIFLDNKTLNQLIQGRNARGVSNEITTIVQFVRTQVSQALNSIGNGNNMPNTLTINIPNEIQVRVEASRNLFIQIFGTESVKNFSQLSVEAKIAVAVEMMIKLLPSETVRELKGFSNEQIVAGLKLVRGLIAPGDKGIQTEKLIAMLQTVDTNKTSLTSLRDFGKFVKVLFADAAIAKSYPNLQSAVEKFVRIVAAINYLDSLLAAVKLAGQTSMSVGQFNRNLAIVQVYDLINRLILMGEKALKEVVQETSVKNAALKNDFGKLKASIIPFGTVEELSRSVDPKSADAKINGVEGSLRQFLEFNPMFVNDNSASAFNTSDDAAHARSDFMSQYQNEIDDWLNSGKHRFVKDVDFEKPLGVVIDRDNDDVFSATKARLILVRDGSVQGFHFLKSFLVN